MTEVYLGLGSNLGNKSEHLRMAVKHIEKRVGQCVALSSFYVTEAWGFSSEHSFLNAVVCVRTLLTAKEVLAVTQHIEREMGRAVKSQAGVYADRVIDIDILLYGDEVLTTDELILPHPLLEQREFVLTPLCEIAPDLSHPVSGKSMRLLRNALK